MRDIAWCKQALVLVQKIEGAYSCICLVKDVGLVVFRDPNGIRPLVLGTRLTPDGPEWCVASEDCAFGPIGFKAVRDVQPGELIIITEDGDCISSQCVQQQLTPCIFEYIYLARPDSVLNKISVYAPATSPQVSLPIASISPALGSGLQSRRAPAHNSADTHSPVHVQVSVPAFARSQACEPSEGAQLGH